MKQYLRKILPESVILFSHKIRAILANIYYGFPGKKMIVIGITGTNGKTTTANLVNSILEEAGFKVGLVSTVNISIAGKEQVNETKMTTQSPFKLLSIMADMVKAKCQYAIIEVTSHALVQHRVWGIPFDVAVMTNISHEHLDFHKTMDEYKKAKALLFSGLKKSMHKDGVQKVIIVNRDDPNFTYFNKFEADYKLKYGILGGDISTKKTNYTASYSQFYVTSTKGDQEIKLNLPGRFNVQNALAAIAVGLSQGVPLSVCKKGLEKVKLVPGRVEKIEVGQPFTVIVDYAHTPDALKKLYEALSNLRPNRIIAVLGACGDRDKTKRPILGALAGRFANLVFITNEDPYTEDPDKIIEEVASGVPKGRKDKKLKLERDYFKISDREQALKKALTAAGGGDLVVVTGKGAEECIVVGDKKVPWSDRDIIKKILKELGYSK